MGERQNRKSLCISSNKAIIDVGKEEWPLKPADAQQMGNIPLDGPAGHT